VVRNGADPAPPVLGGKALVPTLCVVGRLVPHKQVEHALDAALALRQEFPDLVLHVVGAGWWEGVLHEYARTRGAGSAVVFHGHVDERRKHEIYERAWVMLLPSMKEGWGLVVPEAGAHRTPTVAYTSAGGTTESVQDGVTGLLVADPEGLIEATRGLLADADLRHRMGAAAARTSAQASWAGTTDAFATVLAAVMVGRRVGSGLDWPADPRDTLAQ
jgi:glycosyltransferase involved in cell wall biosynthesis